MSEFEKNRSPEEPYREAPQAQGISDIEAFAASATREVKAKRGSKRRREWVMALSITMAAVLVGSLLALPWLLPKEEEPTEPDYPDTSVIVVDEDLDEDGTKIENPVKLINIKTSLDNYTLALNDDGVWKMKEEEDLIINTEKVQTLVDEVLFVQALDTVATDVEDMSIYGLDNPTLTLYVEYGSGRPLTMRFASTMVGSNYYLRLDEEKTVYLIDNSLVKTAMEQPVTYANLVLISSPPVNKDDPNGVAMLKQLSLTGAVRDNVITTVRPKESTDSDEFANSNYLLTAPYYMATNSKVTTEVFSKLEITAEEAVALHPTEGELKEYGLDEPRSVAAVELGVFTTGTDEEGGETVSGYYNEQKHLVRLGKKTSDGTCYYAMVDTHDVIYRINAEDVPWAEMTYHDFANQYLFLRNLPTLQSITCTMGDAEYAFHFTHAPGEDTNLTVTWDGKTMDTDEFRELYQVLMTLYRTGAAPAEPQGEPILSVRISSTDEELEDCVIDIYEYSGSVCIARTETGDTYKMTASRVLDAMEQIENYVNGRDVINRF